MFVYFSDLDEMTEKTFEPRPSSPQVVPVGGRIVFKCRPPKGLPDPTIRWAVLLPRGGMSRVFPSLYLSVQLYFVIWIMPPISDCVYCWLYFVHPDDLCFTLKKELHTTTIVLWYTSQLTELIAACMNVLFVRWTGPFDVQITPGDPQDSIRDVNGSLMLQNAVEADSGNYSCIAENMATTRLRTIELVVSG